MRVEMRRADFEFKTPFRIAYRVRTHAQTVQLELHEGDVVGRAEALGVSYRHETVDTILQQLTQVMSDLRQGISRADVQHLLPAGGARNAVDCALWDLEAKRSNRRAWELAGFASPRPLQTTYTLGADTPRVMSEKAAAVPQCSMLKLKMTGAEDLERIAEVRRARPDAQLIVDANQAWNLTWLHELMPQLVALGVRLIEQPLPVGEDEALVDFDSPIPLCADESCQTSDSIDALIGKYQYVNIKLDKTGGLTEALALGREARARGLKLMVGCMGGSSLSMAPAFVVGQWCDLVDLDSPLLLTADIPDAIDYQGDRVQIPSARLWG
jgi:L-alanine-DL-glutamate epimerase-like enolase superfamily enzyme